MVKLSLIFLITIAGSVVAAPQGTWVFPEGGPRRVTAAPGPYQRPPQQSGSQAPRRQNTTGGASGTPGPSHRPQHEEQQHDRSVHPPQPAAGTAPSPQPDSNHQIMLDSVRLARQRAALDRELQQLRQRNNRSPATDLRITQLEGQIDDVRTQQQQIVPHVRAAVQQNRQRYGAGPPRGGHYAPGPGHSGSGY